MSEFFEKLSKQIIDYWNKFDNKQRTTIIVLGVLIIIFLSTAVYFATRPTMVTLYEGMTMEEASAITKVLQENNIAYEATDDGRTIKVEDKYQTQAKYLLADTTLPSSDYTYEDAYNSSMTDTENIKQEKLHQAMETELEQTLIRINGIEDANVILEIPDYDRLYQNNVKESKASVVLTTSKKLEQGQVNSIVGIVLNGVENLSEENITIVDNDGDTLYGGDLDQESAIVDKKFQNKVKQEDLLEKKIEELLASSYDRVTAKVNLVFDYNEFQSTKETYSNPTGDGSDTGLIDKETKSSSSATNTQTGGAPGIDSNPGETTQYATSNSGTQSESETENESADYIYNKDVTFESKSPGEIKYDDSSIAVNLINYKIYDEAVLEESGQLEETTWDDFKATIAEENFVVNDPVIASVKNATGINKVEIYGVTQPIFIDKATTDIPYQEYLLILIVAFLVVMLAYVIYKGTEPVEVTEIIPELSVEELLSKNIEEEVEEIQDDESTGIKKEIERFVDEKPEAAAQLLRNWLSQDWE